MDKLSLTPFFAGPPSLAILLEVWLGDTATAIYWICWEFYNVMGRLLVPFCFNYAIFFSESAEHNCANVYFVRWRGCSLCVVREHAYPSACDPSWCSIEKGLRKERMESINKRENRKWCQG